MAEDAPGSQGQRLDRWLWFARFFKSRSLATRVVAGGHVRLNRARVAKAHQGVRVGDVLTFPQGNQVRVVRVAGLGLRRGPAPEARLLYDDLTPPPEKEPETAEPRTVRQGLRPSGAGRPTKAERRAIDRLRDNS